MKAKTLTVITLLAVLALTLSGPATVSVGAGQTPVEPAAPLAHSAGEGPGVRASPVMFIQNVGQFADGARFQVRGGDKTIWLAEDALWVTVSEQGSRGAEEQGSGGAEVHDPLHLRPPAPQPKRGVNIRLSFPGANPHPRIEPFHRLDTVVSYFIGNDPAKWHVAVPVWGGVRYVDLYPGVDLELTGENGQVVPRLVAHPGADLSAVRLRVEGAKEVALLPSPDVGRGAGGEGLLLRTALGDFTLPLFQVEGRSAEPAQAQRVDGLAFEVSHPFTAGNEAVRAPSSMVHSQQAVSLLYAGFLGGSGRDVGYGIAVDASGNAYVTGKTDSSDFPAVVGPDLSHNGYTDAFVAKVNPSGTALVYVGFLGGSYHDHGHGIAVDASGNAYVTGWTDSSDFPAVVGPDTSHNGGDGDAFVAKVGAGGLSISHIEVTQATQDANNSVPLIAGKPTFVRVYVDCGAGCASLPNVTGVLRGYGPSGELPGSPLSPTGFMRSITAYHESWQFQRGDLRKTLNFTLPPEWLTGTITLTAEISGTRYSEMVPFRPAQTVRVIYVPIRYKGRSPDPVRIHTGSSWALQVFPTSRINYVPGTTLDWDQCLKKSVLCPLWYHNSLNLLNRLTTMYHLVNAYVYGWLPEGTYNGGISDPTWNGGAGKAAFGDDHPSEGRRIFAHEIGHLLGRRHTNSVSCKSNNIDPRTDWPWVSSDSLIHEWGLDGYSFGWLVSSPSALKNPASTYDYMSYCGSLNDGNVWTSSWTYSHIFSETLRLQGAAQAIQAMTAITQPYFIASGLVYTDDTAIIDPIWVITPTEVPQNPPAGTQYCLEAQDAGGTVLSGHCFDLAFRDYETGEATGVDGFNLMLPYPSGVARIVLRKGAQQLAVRPVSAHVPTVTVLFPNGGETWAATGTYAITWTASDADGDPLAYSVLYSPNGSDWLPVAAGITQTQVAVNAAELAGGNAARVRVLASDGVNTTADESDAPFTVARKGPQAFILSPERDIIIVPGTPLWLQGYAYDLEDGTLPDTALRWSSSRDGNLGTGSQVLVSLSPGEHVITLTATDSDGNVTTATVRVYVGHKIYLPLVLRNR